MIPSKELCRWLKVLPRHDRLATITDAAGRTFTLARDAFGCITSVTDPAGKWALYSYNGEGMLTSITDVLNGVTTYTYDAARRLDLRASRRIFGTAA